MLANVVNVLLDFLKEFVPALKTEVLILGVGAIVMGICLHVVAVSSGLSGDLTYPVLHPGTSWGGIGGGLALIALTFVFSTPPEKN